MPEITFTSEDSPSTEIIDALVTGALPSDWGPQEHCINAGLGAPPWAAELMEEAVELAQATFEEHGIEPEKSISRDVYCFSMKNNFPLTIGLKELGWRQWQVCINKPQVPGLKAKKTRYPIHLWMSPDGQVAMVKLKTQGKYIPE